MKDFIATISINPEPDNPGQRIKAAAAAKRKKDAEEAEKANARKGEASKN